MTDDHPPADRHGTDQYDVDDSASGAPADADLGDLERTLTDRGEPFARATVVRREAPVSANVGDRALVTSDGSLHGWIGGVACAQSTVVSEAQAAIADGEPRLVGLAPDPADVERPGLEAYRMTCHSEGTLELFVEPVVPATRLLVVGDSPIARSLVRLASELAVQVTLVDPDGGDADVPGSTTRLTTLDPERIAASVGPGPLVVVASMGQYDARGVAAGLLADAPYVGLVASEVRAADVAERAAGLLGRDPETVREAVSSPAGVDIAAHTAAEIAVSILAELVDVRSASGTVAVADPERDHESSDETATEGADGNADEEPHRDPVCGMTVDPDGAPSVAHDGETYYFCCAGCADSFRADPAAYLDGQGQAAESG
ncbi:XdhC family protein [Halomarina salina]|uniref:XdhC family protein n=1 Tax=Halomarina salina TaxID=1872699 RepID=A0ABD5RME6_9EURY|nr:XdhC family protein [Halomarina salina]